MCIFSHCRWWACCWLCVPNWWDISLTHLKFSVLMSFAVGDLDSYIAWMSLLLTPKLWFHCTLYFSEEDEFGNYAHLLLKYFLAEGIICGHHIHLSSADKPASQILQVTIFDSRSWWFILVLFISTHSILQELPAPIVNDPGVQVKESAGADSNEDMKIAWRYKNLPEVQVLSLFGYL